jgi:protein-disulfide isomerase
MSPRLSAVLALAFGLVPVGATVADERPTLDRAAIEAIVHDYLVQHPEVLEEAMAALEKKQAAATAENQAKVLVEKAAVLFDSPRQVVLGNPKGDVTLVEFFDYNCGYCKRALPDMLALLDRDKNLRVVLKEFPVLGPGSVEAAKVAVAVGRVAPEKYLDFHKRLLAGRGEANRARALDAANSAGVDSTALDRSLADGEIGATLEEVYGLANGLGLNGTPSYVVGTKLIPGAVGAARLEQEIRTARCTTTGKC